MTPITAMSTTRTALTLLAALALTLTACRKTATKTWVNTQSQPYEVLVVGDRDSTLQAILRQPVATLPQPEPSFDVTSIPADELQRFAQRFRTVVIHTDRDTFGIALNRYARPQMVVYTNGSDAARLHRVLNQYERTVQLHRLKSVHHTQREQEIARQFGLRLLIPASMTACKRGKDFVWLSNNAPEGMQNLLIYTLRPARGADLQTLRDSAWKANIKGETDQMFMRTIAGSVTTHPLAAPARHRQWCISLSAGLWEMEGDAMGGPFESWQITRPEQDDVLCVDAFVYAPEKKKRNLMRQLEAVLYTIKLYN